VTLGVDSVLLGRLTRTSERRTIAGLRFVKHVSHRKDEPITEIWWNKAHAFPQTVVSNDGTGSTSFSVDRVSMGVDATLLRGPAERFPGYRVVDVADWLDRH
jgi:hypothetical protein